MLISTYVQNDRPDRLTQDRPGLVVGFYICGESFSADLIDNDISDTIGLATVDHLFYYLVDYDGPGNTYFFTSRNHTKVHLNISTFMPYDSTELNLGTELVLSNFIGHLFSMDPIRTCLVIWGHGKGVDGICFDGSSHLTGQTIKDSFNGRTIDLLVLDACDMATADLLYDLQGSCRFVAASQKDLPDRGIDYFGGFTTCFKKIGWTVSDLGRALIDESFNFYSRHPSRFSFQLSLISMDELARLCKGLISQSLIRVRYTPDHFESGKLVDLGLMLTLNLYHDLANLSVKTVLHQRSLRSNDGIDISQVTGLSITYPPTDSSRNSSLMRQVRFEP